MLKLVLIFILFLFSVFLSFKYLSLKKRKQMFDKYFFGYLKILTSARYGNLNLKCEEGIDELTKRLSKLTNDFLDSVKDRDKMINEYIEKEKQSQNLKQDFVSSLAHDLKVPIIAQDNTYDLLLNDVFGKLNEPQQNAIKNLKVSNNDLKNLVLDLLEVHKIDSSEIVLDLKNVNLNNLINEVIDQNRPILIIKEKNVIFNPADIITFEVDETLMKRALNNLISNAIFYGKNSKNIYINLEKTDADIQISVSDEGEGINEKDINNIFKKYYSASKKYSNIGVGLGLYIVNKIAAAHKGTVIAKNNKNKGACFTIKLPF